MKQPKLGVKYDRRNKLTPEQRETIISLKDSLTIAKIAKQFGVQWNTIAYVFHPEKLEVMRTKAKEKGTKYYDKDKQMALNKATKEYKLKLLQEGKL